MEQQNQDKEQLRKTLLQDAAAAPEAEQQPGLASAGEETNNMPDSPARETSADVSPENSSDIPFPVVDGIVTPDGNFVPEWYKKFEELKDVEKSLTKFRSPAALAKSYAAIEKMRNYPGHDQKDRMVTFRRMVGLPDTCEEFSLECPEGISPEEWNTEMARDMAGIAYEYGVPPQAMAALSQRYAVEYQKAAADAQARLEEQMNIAEQSLQQEWGGSYERNMRQAATMVERLSERAGIDASELMENPSFGGNPEFIRLMREVALMVGESPLKGESTPTPDSSNEARRIESDPAHPLHDAYMNVNHPNHKFANETYDRMIFGRM